MRPNAVSTGTMKMPLAIPSTPPRALVAKATAKSQSSSPGGISARAPRGAGWRSAARQSRDEADVIAEEAARFRALSNEQQVHELDECFKLYQFLIKTSGRAQQLIDFGLEEERLSHLAVLEFAKRHGYL